jgi:hypothetical protein
MFSRKVPIILVRFSKNPHKSYFMKIRPVAAKLFQGDRHYKPNSRFLKFYKRAQNLEPNANSCPPLPTVCDQIQSAQNS